MATKLKVPRGADFLLNYIFPEDISLEGYTAAFNVYLTLNGAVLLTFGTTPSGNASEVVFAGNVCALVIKLDDVDALPVDMQDSTSPAILQFDLFFTSPEGETSKVHGGAFIVEPFGSSISANGTDINVTFAGIDIFVTLQSGSSFTESPTGSVRFDAAQSLTNEQKLTARTNISAPSITDVANIAAGLVNLIDEKEPVISPATSADIWQGDKVFTPKLALPISTAAQTALDLKANLAAPTFQKAIGAAATNGGRIIFDLPISGSTLAGPPRQDIVGNQMRFFEGAGTVRGAFLDLARADTGVGSELSFRSDISAALVNAPLTGLPTAPTQADGASSGLIANKERVVREIWRAQSDVRFYGAALDGSTDDSAAINAAISASGTAYIPYTNTGFVAKDIPLGIGQRIKTDNRQPKWILPASASYGVLMNAYHVGTSPNKVGDYTEVEGFVFDGAACLTSTTGIRFKTSGATPVFGARLTGLSFVNMGEAIGDESSASNYVVDLEATEIYCAFLRGRQIYIRRSAGFIQFVDTKIDQTFDAAATMTYEGARFENAAGLTMTRFHVLGTPFDATPRPSSLAVVIATAVSVWLDTLLVDTVNGSGFYAQDVQNLVSKDTQVNLAMQDSITLVNVTKSRLTNTSVFGGKTRTGAPAGSAALRINSCADIVDVNTQLYDCTGAGKVVTNTTDCRSSNTTVRGMGSFGIIETGTSNRNVHDGATVNSNVSAALTQVGAQSQTTNLYPTSALLVPSTFGAATVA